MSSKNNSGCSSCGGEASPVVQDCSTCGSNNVQTCGCSATGSCSGTKTTTKTVTNTSCDGASKITVCEEDHTTTIEKRSFAAAIKVTNNFNFPAIGVDTTLNLENVTALIPGSILWNPEVGILHVISFDVSRNVAVVQNQGDACNVATPGDLVPECTQFVVTAPPCNQTTQGPINSGSFLAADFTGFAVGSCETISVTTIAGLTVGDIISINTFEYRINNIINSTTIEICNDGNGAPVGQVIEKDPNGDGILDFPIVLVQQQDPCASTGVSLGQLLACSGGVPVPFVGTQDGQIPGWDQTNERWQLINANISSNCDALTVCLTIDAGDVGPYLVTVNSTAIFTVGEIVVIGGIEFTVDTILDATQMRLTATSNPPAIVVFPVGEPVCVQDCCAVLPDLVDQNTTNITNNTTNITNNANDISDINDILNDPCFPQQLLQVTPISFLATQRLQFQPTPDGPGGNFRRHYDLFDIHADNFFDLTYNAPACNVYAEVELQFNITMAVLGTDPDIVDVHQFHDFVLGANGDFNSAEPRAFVHNKGGANFTHFLDGQGTQPPPPGFILAFYAFVAKRQHFTLRRGALLTPSSSVQFQVGHRLSLSGPIQQVNWPGGNRHWKN